VTRDLPYVGVTLSEQIQPNSVWYKRLLTRGNNVSSAYSNPTTNFTSIGQRTYAFRTRRGRTYELGRVEAGECNLTVDNSDSYFDPANNHSKLFRPLAITAAYPLTGNLLNDTNLAKPVSLDAPSSTANSCISVGSNDSNFDLGAISNWYTLTGGVSAYSGISHSGSYSMLISSGVSAFLDVPCVANKTVTYSIWVRTGSGTSTGSISIYSNSLIDSSTTATATTSFTANTTWTRYSVTAITSAPKITINVKSTASSLLVDDVQVEFGSSATTNTTTGPTVYELFSGFVERYPQTYQAPNRGEVTMVATDVIASLTQVTMPSLYETIVLESATNLYYYPLSEPAGSLEAYNQSPYNQSPLLPALYNASIDDGYASPVFGITTTQTSIPGGGTTGCDFSGQSSPLGAFQGAYLTNNTINDIIFNVGDVYTFSFWANSRTASNGDPYFAINWASNANSTLPSFTVRQGASGSAQILTGGGSGTSTTSGSFPVNSWGFLSLAVTRTNSTTYTASLTVNGGSAAVATWTNSSQLVVENVIIGGNSSTPLSYNTANATTLAHLSIHRGAINASNFYAIGKYAQLTASTVAEQTGTRFANVVSTFSGFPYLPYATDLGKSQIQALNTNGFTVADYLQLIADTEGGVWYVDGSGYLTFKDRLNRQTSLVPKVIFGDATGEVAYEGKDITINYDPTYVLNSITIDRNGGATLSAQDSTSISEYYPRTYNKVLFNGSDAEAADAVYYLLSKYKEPSGRPDTITLTPVRNPAIWNTVLGLEIGDFVRLKKRPIGGTAITVDCFIERVEHHFDAQSADWVTTVTLSPALAQYWNLGALRATSNGAGSAGSIRLTKSSNRNTGGIVNVNDLKQGNSLIVQYTNSSEVTYVGVTLPSQCTDASGYVVMSAVTIGQFTSGSQSITEARSHITQNFGIDTTGTLTLDSTPTSPSNLYWLEGELITATAGTNTLTVTARGLYGTTPQAHFSGETLYAVDSATSLPNPANGIVVSEFLGNNTPYSNNLTRLPYAAGTYNGYDTASVLGSWNNTLASGTYNVINPSTSSYPSVLYYNQFTVNALTDFQNYPVNDLNVGQIITVQNSNELMVVVYIGSPDSTSGVWSMSAYSLVPKATYNYVLASDVSIDQTTITATTTFPSTIYGVWIGGEFMSVTAGAGTTTLTVVRGTPDLLAWGKLGQSRHYAGDQVYILKQGGSSTTFNSGDAVIEGETATIVTGTTKLGY